MRLPSPVAALLLFAPLAAGPQDAPPAGANKARATVTPLDPVSDRACAYEIIATGPGVVTVALLDRLPREGDGPAPGNRPGAAAVDRGERFAVARCRIDPAAGPLTLRLERSDLVGKQVLEDSIRPLFGEQAAAAIRESVADADRLTLLRWSLSVGSATQTTRSARFFEVGPALDAKVYETEGRSSSFQVRSGSGEIGWIWWCAPVTGEEEHRSVIVDPATGDVVIENVVDGQHVPPAEIPGPVVVLHVRYDAG